MSDDTETTNSDPSVPDAVETAADVNMPMQVNGANAAQEEEESHNVVLREGLQHNNNDEGGIVDMQGVQNVRGADSSAGVVETDIPVNHQQASEEPPTEAQQQAEDNLSKEQETTVEEKEETASETPMQQEVIYSTRGRSADVNPLDRLAREALGDLGRAAEELAGLGGPAAVAPESFLSDSLTEEERRTRTRYIPQVSGMHMLRKHEIKGDLSLARAVHSSAGVPTTLAKTRRKRGPEESTNSSDADGPTNVNNNGDDEPIPPSEDERISDILRLGSKTVTIGSNELVLPSPVFVAPSAEQTGEKTATGTTKRSPRLVEAVTAFNPPRPPESVGAKKKHRMLRWERRPADIQVDLHNYQKTVQRTQEELRNAQAEQERTTAVDNLLRLHFLHHIHSRNAEMTRLNQELLTTQQECIDAADLLTSRTRRAGNRNHYAMRDVLHVLRTRGAQIQQKGLVSLLESSSSSSSAVGSGDYFLPIQGAGGVGRLGFANLTRDTVIQAKANMADAWIVPGDKVESPYGAGTVLAFYPASPLNVQEPPRAALLKKKKTAMDIDSPGAATSQQDSNATKDDGGKKKRKADKAKEEPSPPALIHVLAPRVAVQLSFGVGFFPLDQLRQLKENPATFSDERLAQRWKGLYETALAVAPTLDVEGMANILDDQEDDSRLTAMDEGGVGGAAKSTGKRRLLPFGAEMLPSIYGRGSLLLQTSLEELDKALDNPLYEGGGVVGVRNNPNLPAEVSEMENLTEEKLSLQAQALQLRNKLYRQRRTRTLNERTRNATQERAVRVESLVAEMRTDLKSLKTRLDAEIRDLGVSEEEAESILANFYKSLDSQHAGEASPPKRQRRHSEMEEPEDDDVGMEEDAVDEQQEERIAL